MLRVVLLILALCTAPLRAETVTVFAATSLQDALDRIAADWAEATGHQVTASYAGSATLARQLIAGAPADLYISASPEWMDALAEQVPLQPFSRRDLLGNTLVLVAHGEGPAVTLGPGLDMAALLAEGPLAMGEVNSVPAGIYGREALEYFGLWEAARPLVAQTDNVRAALALVATGEAPFGIVYGSDLVAALAAGADVRLAATFPPQSHRRIVFPAAALTPNPAAAAFLRHLAGPEAAAVFNDFGFLPADG
jgi:molybdate transport system substrate-binding protein